MSLADYDLIDLCESDDYWARGHIDDAEATRRLGGYLEEEEGKRPGRCVAARHTYARWVPSADVDGWGTHGMEFRPNYTRGPGAFPVTLVAPWRQVRRERARRAMAQARQGVWEAEVLQRYPEAEDVEVWGGERREYPVHARVRLPGLLASIRLSSDDKGKVWVSSSDAETWRALYAGRW